MPLVLFSILERASLDTSNCLFLFHAACFALGNKPALIPNGAQNAALDDLFAEAFEQRILRFTIAQMNCSQSNHLLSLVRSHENKKILSSADSAKDGDKENGKTDQKINRRSKLLCIQNKLELNLQTALYTIHPQVRRKKKKLLNFLPHLPTISVTSATARAFRAAYPALQR
jgi:hypothetical protein